MKVLLYLPACGRGGVSLIVRKIFQGLADYAPPDWQFHILGQQWNEIHEKIVYPSSFSFEQIDPVDRLPLHPEQFNYLWQSMEAFAAHLTRVAPSFDIVWSPSIWWAIRAKCWSLDVPLVTTISDMAWDTFSMSKSLDAHFWLCTKLIHERSSHVVFSSAYWQRHAIENHGYDPAKTTVVQSSADFVAANFDPSPEEAERVRQKYGLPGHYILSFHPMGHKDPETILNAQFIARRASATVPPLVFAGIDTDLLLQSESVNDHIDRVKMLLEMLKFNPGLDFFCLGRIPEEDIAGLYAGATLSISASKMEGDLSGNTLNSFMAHCPHIYSDIPVYTMRIGCDKLGYTFQTGNPMSLSQQMTALCENPEEARKRAIAAYAFAATRTVKDVANEYIDVFRRVVDG